jgi:mono/diheme cytochrome c family protein
VSTASHIAAAAAAVLLGQALPARAVTPPGFNAAVAPILARHCANCHSEGGSMPGVPLTSYEAVKAAAPALRAQVASRAMPPWFADPAQSVAFRNDARLSAAEIDTLLAWVDGGMPRGEGSEPSWPGWSRGWANPQGSAPDVIVGLPRVRLPATGEIPYVRLLIKVTVPADRWIVGLQALPGNASVVHHMGITEVTLADGVTPENMAQLDAVARQLGMPGGSLTRPQPSITDANDPSVYDMLSIYTPGTTFESFGPGAGKLLRAGAQQYINFNIHYTTSGKPETDQSNLGLWFASSPPAHQLYRAPLPGRAIIANGRELLTDDPGTRAEGTDFALPPIAPGEEHYRLIGMTALLNPMTVYALQPHAHLRSKSFRYVVIMPDGHELTLLNVPRYDFHWQLRYELAEPLLLPAGSKLVVTGEYDNSEHNAHLAAAAAADPTRRCGPDKTVLFRDQNQTWDEMFSPIVEYALARQGAPDSGVRLVAAAGCLTRAASGGWLLSHIGHLDNTSKQSTSSADTVALAKLPGGNLSVGLIGESPFDPARLVGQRVAAKGALIGTRLNVTSLQGLGQACAR